MRSRSSRGSRLLPRLLRPESVPDGPDELAGHREAHRAVHREDKLAVHFHIIHAVIPGDQAKARELRAELLENRVRVLHRLRLITARKAVPDQDFRHRYWHGAVR